MMAWRQLSVSSSYYWLVLALSCWVQVPSWPAQVPMTRQRARATAAPVSRHWGGVPADHV